MKKFLAKQWLVYLGCLCISVLLGIFDHTQNSEHSLGLLLFESPFTSILLYIIYAPIQLTIWALKNDPILWNHLKDIFSFPNQNNKFKQSHSSLN